MNIKLILSPITLGSTEQLKSAAQKFGNSAARHLFKDFDFWLCPSIISREVFPGQSPSARGSNLQTKDQFYRAAGA